MNTPTAAELLARLDLARVIAREAGEITLSYFQRPDLSVERKGDSSPVTVADRDAERHLRKRIAEKFPHDAILGEELEAVAGTSGYRWILDPIDGTKSFITGVPLYSTLVGVEKDGQALVGLIRIPALDEQVYAAVGRGAWHQRGAQTPVPARVSQRALSSGAFVTSQVDSFAKRGAHEAFERLSAAAYVTRTWGDGYGYLLVATGRAELMVDPIMNVWDAAAIQPILEEAGGTFTDWSGRPTIHAGEGIATNGRELAAILAITRPFGQAARQE
jgi:histidinol phosphatase-like enzyme (inositol monophosphatase family)